MQLSPAETEVVARLALAALAAGQGVAASAGHLPQVAPTGPTIADWMPTYRRLVGDGGYSQQTLRNRATTMGQILTLWGDRPLRGLKPQDVSAGLRKIAERSTHTAHRIHGELREFFMCAVENGEAETNPVLPVRPPKHRTERCRLSLEAWQAMLDRAKTHPQRWLRAMLLLAMLTGQRRADLAAMRFDHVVDGHLRVEQQKKAGKARGFRVAIPLSLRLECVGMSVGDVIELCKTIGKPGDHLLRQANGRPIEMSSLSARFHELIVEVLGKGAYPDRRWPSLHEVRSLSARTYKAEGMADRQGLLGHASEEMTAVYEDARDLHDDSTWHVVGG